MREGNFKATFYDDGREFDFSNYIHRMEARYDKEFVKDHFKVNDGCATIVGIRYGDRLYYGVSLCSPNDNFSKKEGRQLAGQHFYALGTSHKRGVYISDNLDALSPSEALFFAFEDFLGKCRRLPAWAQNPAIRFRRQIRARRTIKNVPVEARRTIKNVPVEAKKPTFVKEVAVAPEAETAKEVLDPTEGIPWDTPGYEAP